MINGVTARTLDEPESCIAATRTFDFLHAFYSIYKSGKRVFLLEKRPNGLKNGAVPTQRDIQAHQVAQKRFAEHPIKKAEYYQRLMQSTGASSIRRLAEITGEDWSYLAKLLRVLTLPQGIRDFLTNNPFPEIIKHFHLRRLLEILRTGDAGAQLTRFHDMLGQISSEQH